LVVLSIAVGVFAVGVIGNSQAILSRELAAGFASVNPASATLETNIPFDDDLVEAIRRMPIVQEAEGRYSIDVRLQVGPDEWLPLNLLAIDDYDDIRINLLRPEAGAWPPPKHALLLERSSLGSPDLEISGLPELETVKIGDLLRVETPGNKERELRLAGLAYEFNRTPSGGSGTAYGYITQDTLEWLGEPRDFNEVSIIVAGNTLDEEHVFDVVKEVEDKIEKSGRTVERIEVPPPGEHPLDGVMKAILFLLGALGSLSFLASGFLVVNTISALLTQQVRQIGVMKSIGARPKQIMGMYLSLALILGLLALVISIPLGVLGANLFSRFMANMLNLDITSFEIPPYVFALEITVGLTVPFLAALYPVIRGARITVQKAISNYGLGQGQFGTGWLDRWLRHVHGRNRPLLLTLRNTFRRRGRLILTLSALTLSGALFIAVISARASLYRTLDNSLQYRQYDLWVTMKRPYRAARLEREARDVPGVVRVESFGFSSTVSRPHPDGRVTDNFVMVALPAGTDMFLPPVIRGRWLRPDDEQAIVVNNKLLEDEPDIEVGAELELEIEGRETTWRVVGIADEAFAIPTVYVNYPYFTRAVREVGRARGLWVTTEQRGEEAFQAEVTRSFEEQFREANLRIRSLDTMADLRSFQEFHYELITVVLLMMAFLLAAVGGLGLMGTMSINVLERRREIGVMRSIGASDRTVKHLVIAEGSVITLLSWFIAVLVAFPLGKQLGDAVGMAFLERTLNYTFALSGVLLWFAIVVGLAALASYVPAQSASRLTVREVLAYE
jgi:putative ABC transport system permease protein